MKEKDRYEGCLIAGAAGDALGFPVEFDSADEIFSVYGPEGISSFELNGGKGLAEAEEEKYGGLKKSAGVPVAEISDDTQMTLFTASAILSGTARAIERSAAHSSHRSLDRIFGTYPRYLIDCYGDWYRTQTESYPVKGFRYSWLLDEPRMFAQRSAGNTCMTSMDLFRETGDYGTLNKKLNNSKGNGGMMRVAPIGLLFDPVDGQEYGKKYSYEDIQLLAAKAAALTHGHDLGQIPAAMFAHIVSELAHDPSATVLKAVRDSLATAEKIFAGSSYIKAMRDITLKAVDLASAAEGSDLDHLARLGSGWTAEETLAIAIYCALRYSDNIEKALIVSVNHDGDSDSTGSVTGNILGAKLGMSAIPDKFKNNIELEDIIIKIADDLYECGSGSTGWEKKYSGGVL